MSKTALFEGRAQIQDVVRSIIDVLSKPHNSTLLLAVREVRVDTQDPHPQVGESDVSLLDIIT